MLRGLLLAEDQAFRYQYSLAVHEFYEDKELGNYVSVVYKVVL